MFISFEKRIEDTRFTRCVMGKYKGIDISTIFENEEVDFLTTEPITHENFDDDDVYYIQKNGYTRRKALFDWGFKGIECDNLFSDIKETMLIERKLWKTSIS
jgi:hypothetical protein